MKRFEYIIAVICILAAFAGCTAQQEAVEFDIDVKELNIGPDGGKAPVRILSSGEWNTSSNVPWITVSPANGRGTVDCELVIDSTLYNTDRVGYLRIENLLEGTSREIKVTQTGYPYAITLEDEDVSVANYAGYDYRTFNVTVSTNVDFEVAIPDTVGWLSNKSYSVRLERGVRPRNVTLTFEWKVNSLPWERLAEISFIPKADTISLSTSDILYVKQGAAELIEPGTRRADSLAVMGIARALDTWSSWENPEPMDNWADVTLWDERDEGCTPDMVGRVRSASFYLFGTKEGLPYEVQYLTAAEELYFFGNENSFLYELSPGDYISELTQLKRLTIGAYGLTELPESFARLKNLEMLSLYGNNFETVPAILTPENFPNLHSLDIGANQRTMIYDLSNTVYTNFGGLYQESEFPRRLLEWEKLDTLLLSVNYLQGSIPDMKDYEKKWTAEEVAAADTLPQALVGTPKVLPNMKHLAINLNRMTGDIPEWILHHPALDWWIPDIFIFNQEGKDEWGASAGFNNEPANLNYYYEYYKGCNKRLSPEYQKETE